LAESDSRGDGEAAEIELTYSTTGGTSQAKPELGTLKLRIIQVKSVGKTGCVAESMGEMALEWKAVARWGGPLHPPEHD
jgi:hypothetical protein